MQRLLMWSACLLGVAGALLLMGTPFYSAFQADTAARQREELVVANGVADYFKEIARKSLPQTVWDEAVQNLDVEFDAAWAHWNIGSYFWQTEGFEAAVILDRDNDTQYALLGGRSASVADVRDFIVGAAPLIGTLRNRERERLPLKELVVRGETRSAPINASTTVAVHGETYIVAASLVQPDFGASTPRTSRSAIVVTAKKIDAAVVKALADRFLLADAVLEDDLGAPASGRARAVLRGADGRPVATLAWTPSQPGAQLLAKALPSMLMLIGSLGGLAAIMFRRGNVAAQNLISSEARASHLAFHDVLTGLPNRAMLSEALARNIAELRRDGRPFAVHCIDLDHFKEVNDAFGHFAGDELIRLVARIIQASCRDTDLIARLGGDEFAIIQPGATAECAGALAHRIVTALTPPIELQVGRVFIGGSIGVAMVGNDEDNPQECLRRADLALYRAKASGRGRYVFFEKQMDAAVKTRAALQNDLREALARGELELYYQPQTDARNEVIGLEALARWNHKERGPISPAAFVPIAEETGLIEALGMFTLRRAFEDSRKFGGVRIAVNVSAAQLRVKDFASQLERLVAECAVSPRDFELEITEGLLLGDDPQTRETLRRLRQLGFKIALDDFGTGYSSLGYLQRYPIDKIKIDRSFVARLGAEPQADAVVSAIVRLARALGLSVIAEGVETEAQRLCLTVSGCPDVQGFLTGRPMTASDAAAFLARGQDARPLVRAAS
ncbi:MAG: EAL domain-containing protein [Parvularculaceae bacterium]